MPCLENCLASFPGSPSANAHNVTFDSVEIAESKVILPTFAKEGGSGNEAKNCPAMAH